MYMYLPPSSPQAAATARGPPPPPRLSPILSTGSSSSPASWTQILQMPANPLRKFSSKTRSFALPVDLPGESNQILGDFGGLEREEGKSKLEERQTKGQLYASQLYAPPAAYAPQYREIEAITDFKNHHLRLARIKKIMKPTRTSA